MIGEGEYNIVFEKVSVTESYLGLSEDVRHCRDSEEDYQSCVTKNYVKKITDNCNCLPLGMSLDQKVGINHNLSFMFQLNIKFHC